MGIENNIQKPDIEPLTARQAFRLGIPETTLGVTGELDWRKPSPQKARPQEPAPNA